jgi:hypothetical protein
VGQILFDGQVVCNACEAIDWSDEVPQLVLCEACLITHCGGGGCVAIRRVADKVVIMPDFVAMMRGDWECVEYAPPRLIDKKGALLMSISQWEQFRGYCAGAPTFETITSISTAELVQLYYLQAPRPFLSDPLRPVEARWDLVLCTNGDDPDKDMQYLKALFSSPTAFAGHEFSTPDKSSHTVSAFLDFHGIEEWPVFSSGPERLAYLSDELHFRLHLRADTAR